MDLFAHRTIRLLNCLVSWKPDLSVIDVNALMFLLKGKNSYHPPSLILISKPPDSHLEAWLLAVKLAAQISDACLGLRVIR